VLFLGPSTVKLKAKNCNMVTMLFRSKLSSIKDFIFSRIYLEIIILCIVAGIITAGFLALKYFQSRIDFVVQSQQVEGAKAAQGSAAEDFFGDNIGPCGFKHVPDQTAKKSECAKAIECEIISGKWGLYLSKDDCLNAQKAALAQQTQNKVAPTPTPSAADTNSTTDTSSTDTTPSPTPPPDDTTPDAFSFPDQNGVPLNTTIESNPITVSGIDTASPVSVTGGEYSINGGAYTSNPGTVNAGDTVKVSHTSSTSNSASVDTTLTIGGVSDTFTSTTQ
jgi:hypothetical protein